MSTCATSHTHTAPLSHDTLVRTCAHAHAHSQTERFTHTDGISLVRRVPSPNRYMAVARFCFCKNNKRTIDRGKTQPDTHMHTHAHTYAHTYANTYAHTVAYIHTYTHEHTQIHKRTCAHTHIHSNVCVHV
jgi:hypothetical protein